MQNLIEYSSNCSETTGSLSLYSKDAASNFNADIASDNSFKFLNVSLNYQETQLLKRANAVDGILKNCNNCCAIKPKKQFLEITRNLLINCKAELKLKQTNYCVMSPAGDDNNNDRDDKVIFTIKQTRLYVPVVTLSARENQNLYRNF